MDDRKKYLIEIFLKKCTSQKVMEDRINFSFKLIEGSYNIPDGGLNHLKQKFSLKYYIERICPIIDRHFSSKDLQDAIAFYSSPVGRKIFNPIFLGEISEIGNKMEKELLQEFSLSYAEFSKKNN